MTDRTLRDTTAALYQARLSNDVDGCLAHFGPQASFTLNGSAEASALPVSIKGRDQLDGLLRSLVATWVWTAMDQVTILVDGHQAAIRYTLSAVHRPTGTPMRTEVMDHLVFDEAGHVTELTQFIDTALVNQLTPAE